MSVRPHPSPAVMESNASMQLGGAEVQDGVELALSERTVRWSGRGGGCACRVDGNESNADWETEGMSEITMPEMCTCT